MKVSKITAAVLIIIATPAKATDFASCVSATLNNGEDCKKVSATFDFSKCENAPKALDVPATCWNGKRVAKTNVGSQRLTATFQQKTQWGKVAWELSGVKAAEVKVQAERKEKKVSQAIVAAPAPTPAPESAREPAGVIVPPVAAPTVATTPDESLKIGGLLDFNYVYNSNNPRPVTPPSATSLAQPTGNNTYRAFDLYHDNFNLSLAEINLTKSKDDVTAFVALGYGHTADVLSPNDEAGKHITQATINYKPTAVPRLSLTAGKMMTHLGLEVTKSKDNWNYSRSLLFSWAIPFWHTGLTGSYQVVKDKVTVSGYVYNKTNGAYQNNRSKSFGGQVSAAPIENMVLVYNYLSGNETDANTPPVDRMRTLHEINGTYAITPTISAGFDVVKGSLTKTGTSTKTGNWLAWSLAAKWAPNRFSISPRFEVFEDPDGSAFGTTTGQRLTSQTMTFGFDFGGGLETRIEFRKDQSSNPVFVKGNNNVATDGQFTSTFGLLYNF